MVSPSVLALVLALMLSVLFEEVLMWVSLEERALMFHCLGMVAEAQQELLGIL